MYSTVISHIMPFIQVILLSSSLVFGLLKVLKIKEFRFLNEEYSFNLPFDQGRRVENSKLKSILTS